MNFQDLKRVESADFYLDVAIKRTKKKIDELREGSLRGANIQRSKFLELSKIESIESELSSLLSNIVQSFPSFDNLPEFYRQLLDLTLDVGYLKQSLASIQWCLRKIREFLRFYKQKIKFSTEIDKINVYRRQYYGRVASALKQINKHLNYLEFSRKTMLDYPTIKTSMTTIAIAGFPNVGKSTLLAKLTTAKPKIAHYAFTTKGINIGYAEINNNKIQFLDTPGTLNRFEKMNNIEKIAYIAVKYASEAIIYVFDLTESSYSVDDQIKLLEHLKKTKKPVLIYLSKTDILDEHKVSEFKKKYIDAKVDVEELKKALQKLKVL